MDAPADVSPGSTTLAPANASSAVASTPAKEIAPLPSQPSQQEADTAKNQVQVQFPCDECEDTFNLEVDLGYHKRKAHKDWRLAWKHAGKRA